MKYRDSCTDCSANGCLYCSTNSGIGICSSPAVAKANADICVSVGGTYYSETCVGTGDGQCDAANDSCDYQNNGVCDTYGTSVDCAMGTDCFDCDPCMKHRMTSCETCASNGCLWCGADALCVSEGAVLPEAMLTCTLSNLKSTCPAKNLNPFSDPLYDAFAWAFDLINVKQVWAQGISKWLLLGGLFLNRHSFAAL
jgi:hypothetical protein